ncbi:MAG: histidinol phosphate phosphatase domain-containing protein [Methanobacteriota archaeon]|nr:MAG: histidinol phosphate phosphatase domain-containing protein [Euryarchaeota archaeon]
MPKRYDFHIHSLLTEGELLPSEIAQRCTVLGYSGIAITDHVDASNVELVLGCLVPACRELDENFGLKVLAGVELTHVPPTLIGKMAGRARELGADVVVVHGETIVEPVQRGTNMAALKTAGVDILAHPGLITEEEAVMAAERGVFLELTSRRGHSLANGHVAKTARAAGAALLLNTDSHSPGDLITPDEAVNIAAGCGLTEGEVKAVLEKNPESLLERIP